AVHRQNAQTRVAAMITPQANAQQAAAMRHEILLSANSVLEIEDNVRRTVRTMTQFRRNLLKRQIQAINRLMRVKLSGIFFREDDQAGQGVKLFDLAVCVESVQSNGGVCCWHNRLRNDSRAY
ncbi:hypothetical protein, partial [Rhizobium sp. LjRoot98]|uniref:hypothetical protein n=1 Tax=Rhizobium sp. LjRoot98 TaxID=3342345 RepID=UPI003F508FD8